MLRIALLFVALACGGAAAWLASGMRYTAPAPVAQQVPPQSKEEILVAAAEVPRGHRIGKEHLRWQKWPDGALSAGFITRSAEPDALDKLIGSAARSRIVPNEPILPAKIGADPSGVMARMLPPGRVAVAVRVTAETTAGGFILPADRVDVLHTSGENGRRHSAHTILRNVTVLAIDQAHEVSADDPSKIKPTVGKTATLELTLAQAESLAAAQATGALSLALRSAKDNDKPVSLDLSRNAIRIFRGTQVEVIHRPIHPEARAPESSAAAAPNSEI